MKNRLIHLTELQIAFVVLFCCALAGAEPTSGVFEQVHAGSRAAWRSRDVGGEMLILPDGFILRRADVIRRFRWDPSMRLETFRAEELIDGSTYELSAPGRKSGSLLQAKRVRAISKKGNISVVYYFGSRGTEFDVEVQPGVRPPILRLESMDGDLSLNSAGNLTVAGEPLSLAPVAYTVGTSGHRRFVSSTFRLDDARHVALEVGSYDRRDRLVIDPVMTYATYFGGSGETSAIGLREMPDGSVLLAGNTKSLDLPQGVSLNNVLTGPFRVDHDQRCFVTRLSPADKKIQFVSYFGGSDYVRCEAMDLDAAGRILLAGIAIRSSGLATSGAQYTSAKYDVEGFLARISADGKTLEYSTFLNLDIGNTSVRMVAGPGETAYMAFTCVVCAPPNIPGGYQQARGDALLLRYNIATKRFDQQTYLPAGSDNLAGLKVSPSGAVYVFGSTRSTNLPLVHAVQATPPANGWLAGFVLALSADFRSLLFSTYLGGQNFHTYINSVVPNFDGSLWLNGGAYPDSIPGLRPARRYSGVGTTPFAIQVSPGNSEFRRAFLAGGDLSGAVNDVVLTDGRYCLLGRGATVTFSSGGTAFNGVAGFLGCLNDSSSDFQMLTPLPGDVVAPSRAGGVWTVAPYPGTVDSVPFEFKAGAIQPFRQPGSRGTLLLSHIDLATPNPVLVNPQPVRLSALQGSTTDSVDLWGRNFAQGMELDIQGTRIPLSATGPFTATLSYKSPSLTGLRSPSLDLSAGTYEGRLVIPAEPEAAVSDVFPVIVSNMRPALQPFIPTANRLTFLVAPPVYEDSQVLWNGEPIPLTPAGGGLQVEIPPGMAPLGMGEFTLINQRPGGGVQRQNILIGQNSSSAISSFGSPLKLIRADASQMDRSRELLYAFTSEGTTQWNLASYTLPGGDLVQSTVVAKDGATVVVDFKLSADGAYLYLTDDLLRIMRFRTDTFEQDLRFQLQADAPLAATYETRHSLRVLDGEPESLLVVTPAGRMVIYDRAQPRRYTTSDFPALTIAAMDPVLATSSYVYALSRANLYYKVPCVVRYPVDAFGFGRPEEFCNLGADWGKYPEMKIYAGTLVLQNAGGAYGIRLQPDILGSMRIAGTYDLSRNIVSTTATLSFDFRTREATFNLRFSSIDTGEPVGHYPPATSMTAYPDPSSVTFLDDDTMVFVQQVPFAERYVVIVPNWQNAVQLYP